MRFSSKHLSARYVLGGRAVNTSEQAKRRVGPKNSLGPPDLMGCLLLLFLQRVTRLTQPMFAIFLTSTFRHFVARSQHGIRLELVPT